jgi:molybdopterin/thiamine biosynthesis adenylyltransferase
MSPDLDAEQLDRYARHVIMDEVGPEGQGRLLDAAVLVVGAGGLGSPVVQYLAAAGVGTLGVADGDVVERSNLQRQTLHAEADVGRAKVDSAAAFVAARNPDVEVRTYERAVTDDDARALAADYDVVVDATDNFPSRFLLNDACLLAGTPLSNGAVFRFEGQAATFRMDGSSPCYRCLFPEAPPAGTVPNCAEVGVLGALPGTIGSVQATETLKLLLDRGSVLDDRMLHYDALGPSFETVPLARNPDCPACGADGLDSLSAVDYDGTCAVGGG